MFVNHGLRYAITRLDCRPGAGGGDRGGTRDTGVRFRHNEGLTNAIRRAVRMRDLLG